MLLSIGGITINLYIKDLKKEVSKEQPFNPYNPPVDIEYIKKKETA